jgi:hypothetical protein
MKPEAFASLSSNNPRLLSAVSTLSKSIPLEKISAPSINAFDAPAYARYQTLCTQMHVTNTPTLLIVKDEAYKEHYKVNGARFLVQENTIILQENLWRAFSQSRAEGNYALAHELGHAFEHQETAKPTRRTILTGILTTALSSPAPSVAGALTGIQIAKKTTSDDSISNPNLLAGAIGGGVLTSYAARKASDAITKQKTASRLKTSELFVDKLAIKRLGHAEVIQGLLDFSLSDVARMNTVTLNFASKPEREQFEKLAQNLCKEYPFLRPQQAQGILLLQALSSNSQNTTGYPTAYERVKEILDDYKQSQSSQKSR